MAETTDFTRVLKLLGDDSRLLPAAALYQLSDLSTKNLAALEAAWPDIPVQRRRDLLDDLSELQEADFEVAFASVFRLALEDEDAAARAAAIQALWEDETPDLVGRFLDLLQHDPAAVVRAAAAGALGRFVYLGEMEEISPAQARRVEEALLSMINGRDDLEVRRRALEAMGFSGRPEVPALIQAAYAAPESAYRVSALFAMGRSADAQQWREPVCAALDSPATELRFEAARAAGELELAEAVPALIPLTRDTDSQVRQAALWSLSQISGDEAYETLTARLAEADETEADFIQEALDNLDFTNEGNAFALLEVDDDEPAAEAESGDEIKKR